MVEKKDNEILVGFEITGVQNRTILNSMSNPVDGMIFSFTSKKGVTGTVEIPTKEYTKEKALKLVSQKVLQLEELLP